MENPVWVSFTVKGDMTISFLLSLSLYFLFVCLFLKNNQNSLLLCIRWVNKRKIIFCALRKSVQSSQKNICFYRLFFYSYVVVYCDSFWNSTDHAFYTCFSIGFYVSTYIYHNKKLKKLNITIRDPHINRC